MHEFKGHVDTVHKEVIQYLQNQGFFNVLSSTSSLSNEIEPILARDRFIGISENMYDSMRPGLQLASRFVKDERVLDYFWHQMRSRTLPSQTFVRDEPPPLIYTSDYRLVEKPVLMAEWREKLDSLASVLTWKVQASDRTPTDMDMGLTFAFDELRTTFSDQATNEKTYNEVLRLCNWRQADRSAKIRNGMLDYCADTMGEGWRFRPGKGAPTSPCVLLHSFFRKVLDPDSETTLTEISGPPPPSSVQNLGPQFLLAHVLLHELAHCLDKFPIFKCNDPQGLSMEAFASEEEASVFQFPECGLSWERAIFQGRCIRFHQFVADQSKIAMKYTDIAALAVASFSHKDDRGIATSSTFTVGEKTYKAATDFTSYEKALIPWQWVSDWFQESHWHTSRTREQVLALPSLEWKMSYEYPAPDDPSTLADEIVRIRVKVPHENEQE